MMARNSLIGSAHKFGGGLRVPGRTWRTRLGMFPPKKTTFRIVISEKVLGLQFGVAVETPTNAT